MGHKTAQPSKLMTDFIGQCGGYAVIDGGLATELERHGANLNDPLWSAKCLVTSPQLIRRGEKQRGEEKEEGRRGEEKRKRRAARDRRSSQLGLCLRRRLPCLRPDRRSSALPPSPIAAPPPLVHLDYLEAGANIIISSSYQATLQGFEAKGLSRVEGEALLRKSVEIACEAREIYYSRDAKVSSDVIENRENLKQHPVLVGASVGSYGAYLADGSEYSGIYGDAVTLETLKDFHRRRVQVLAESGADLIAFETIPNKLEAKAYAELLQEEDIKIPAWFSFNSKDGTNVVSGDSISECASIADSCKQVVAVGINCTPPRFIHGLIQAIREVTAKPILIYPNSGETYDADRKVWVQSTGVADEDFVSYVGKWCEAGASLIGGCCRTTPNTIRAISKALSSRSSVTPLEF